MLPAALAPNPEHPDWWIEQLEWLEAIDEAGGMPYGARSPLSLRLARAMARRGLVRLSAREATGPRGGVRITVPWAELTELGRRTYEDDLGPPPITS